MHRIRKITFLTSLFLSLARGWASVPKIYPRVITPNGDGINDRIFFIIDNPTDAPVEGEIFDISYQTVSGVFPITLDQLGKTVLYWDGTHSGGSYVPAGIYLYRLELPDGVFTGSVVVAK
jgi:hypothetical protein